jgi:triacylglycerol lipase
MNKIELWFDRTCDRSKGWFKRKINRWLIVIGLIVAALVNADTIQIFQRLSADPQLRAAAVELATNRLKEEDIIDDGSGSDAPVLELVREQVGEVAPFVGWSDQDPFVIAWSDKEKSTLVAFAKKSIGLLLTAFAISLGAPFWFDLLQKLVNVRQSVVAEKPTAKSTAETTRDAKNADSGQDSGEVLSPASKPEGPMGGFNPIASSVNLENAYWLARAADLAYETDTGKLRSTIESWGLKIHVFESQDPQVRQFWKGKLATVDTQGFIAANENLILICFRGTEPTRPADILTDLQFKPETAGPYGSGEVHRGFKAAIESVWSDVTSQIESMGGNQQPVWFAGHSLGGALAVLAAARYEKESREANSLARKKIAQIEEQLTAAPNDDELIGKRTRALAALRGRTAGVYTIGQPRVGNSEFARDVDARIGRSHVRVINNRDIVPRVPFRAMDFEHSGAVLYIDEFGRLHTDPGLWFRLLDTVVISRSEVEKSREGVQDHSSSAYVDLLDKARADV